MNTYFFANTLPYSFSDFVCPFIAYLIGSIPFGLILSNVFGDGRLRERGSKNIGATNVLRTQGKFLGGLTLLLDFLKAFLPCYFLCTNSGISNVLTLAAPVIGHMFPVWLKFRGGKGVASYFGVLCALDFRTFLLTGVLWLVLFRKFRISSLACLLSVMLSCGIFACSKRLEHSDFFNQVCVLMLLAVFIIIKHHENIKRLLSGKELKL